MAPRRTASTPAENVPYYTPAQNPPAGTPFDVATAPTLFTPLQIRDVKLNNRFVVSPMCMYSADDGHLTDYHLVHLGQFALHGAGLTIVEATAVEPRGRISPEDSGLWADSQVAPLRRVTDFIRSQGHRSGIQLAHAGRKASTLAPWLVRRGQKEGAGVDVGGWPDDVVAPTAGLTYDEGFPVPKELTVDEIEGLVKSFADAAKRAVEAGFDVIEIHGAHGYLITEFLSPITNKRTDQYGGSFENRTRLLLDIIRAVRAVIPDTMPLFVRVSATEWMEHDASSPSWTVDDTLRLARLLPALGVDLLDVSTGGNNPRQKIDVSPYYQVSIADRIRKAIKEEERAGRKGMLIGAVGMIDSSEMARGIVEEEDGVRVVDEQGKEAMADVVLAARKFLREPNWVLNAADDLGVRVRTANQYHRSRPRKSHL